ncbi:hypothetical protein Q31b_23840 [Novipirellula aureliae]|uniref:HEAT repeat domain-containing protein n=1 Tax=Novipirellula aureliae TaxID=2527966 RepID=A0A5C6E3S3_9BACT|nr:HEAT repeat domain-containing protein [Novipirellula aureliae]TWU43345.1 hypothetical protein Q31b_23840 [Novipirellula aureliae]
MNSSNQSQRYSEGSCSLLRFEPISLSAEGTVGISHGLASVASVSIGTKNPEGTHRFGMIIRSILLSIAFLLWIIPPRSVFGDAIELSIGGHLNGEVRRIPEKKVDIVAVDDDIRLAFPTSRVSRVVESDKLAAYRRHAAKAGEDAQLHYLLAVWCADPKNMPNYTQAYKRHHMQMAIRFDPDHERARASLGYVKENNRWIRYSDLQRSRGMISVGGKWVLPEAAAIEKIQTTTSKDAKLWIREIEILLRIAIRGNSKSPEAFASLQAIDDPMAAMAVAKQLLEENHNRKMNLLWVELLGRFKNRTSVEALVRTGLANPDDVVREAAISKLHEFGSRSAVASYTRMLRSNDHGAVTQALRALSYFPDIELAPIYIESLVTKHTKTEAPGAGTQSSFAGDGSTAFSQGGKPKTVTYYLENPGALSLLKTVEPDVDYGYDQQRWREYFAAKRSSYSGDLRRDP